MQENPSITAAEIARLAGVGRAAVSNWRKRHADFPAPVGGSAASPEFDLDQVENWLREQGKLPKVSALERVWQRLSAAGDNLPAALGAVGSVLLDYGSGEQTDARQLDPQIADLLPELHRLAGELGSQAAFDELWRRFSRPAAGRFWATPDDLADLMTELVEVPGNEILDPACGAGANLRAAVRAGCASASGQELDNALAGLARLWLELGNATGEVEAGDALHADAFAGRLFDAVVCHPPFNASNWGQERLDPAEPRWSYGLPPRTEPELAWVEHALAHLRPGGRAVLLLPPAVASRRAGKRIRAALLRRGALRAVIALPPGVAAPHSVPLHLWVLRQPMPEEPVAARVLLVDAATADPRDHADTYARIRETYRAFVTAPDEEAEEVGFARAAPVIELLDEEVDLTPARRQPAASSAETGTQLLGTRDRFTAVLRDLPGLIPQVSAEGQAGTPLTVTVAELARTGALELIGPIRSTARDGKEQPTGDGPLVLTVQDLLAGDPAGGRDVQRLAQQVKLAPGDVVVPMIARKLTARVVATGGDLLGLNLYLLRPNPAALDPWFLAGQLRTTANEKQASSLSGALRFDIRRAQVRRIPLDEQRTHGEAFRRLYAFESAIRQVRELGTDLVQLTLDGLANGGLRPGEGAASEKRN